MINPVTVVLIGVIGGLGAAGTYVAFRRVESAENGLTIEDLRPSMPWEGLPLPRFVYTKPELFKLKGEQ